MTDKIRIALEALKVAYIAMQHMGNVLNNIDAVDEEEDAQHDAAFEAVRAAIAELEQPQETRIVAASMGCYPKADQKFFNFWYGHMFEDRMQPPLVGIDHATARYIWDGAIAALEQPEEAAVMTAPAATMDKSYSRDEETFMDYEDVLNSLEDDDALRTGATIYEGETVHRTASYYARGIVEEIFERMGERAFDDADEFAGDWPQHTATKEQMDEFERLINGWLDVNIKVHFFTVKNVKAITLTEEMVLEFLGIPTPPKD